MTRRLILHVGHPKCASTSLQQSLIDSKEIYYPHHGLHSAEHIALPLKIKGLDKWTSQWISQDWVNSEFKALVNEVNSIEDKTVVLSSERLADITPAQFQQILSLFDQSQIELLLLYRPVEDYVKSMWKHAVFRHDLSEDFELFQTKFKDFNPTFSVEQLSALAHNTHTINISKKNWEKELENILDMKIHMSQDNISAPMECCYFLQKLQNSIGSKHFKEFFTPERKNEFLQCFLHSNTKLIDTFDVPIINLKKND